MNVTVTQVNTDPVQGSVWRGTGRLEDGRVVIFAGEPRLMDGIDRSIREGEVVETEIEHWQVLQVLPADPGRN